MIQDRASASQKVLLACMLATLFLFAVAGNDEPEAEADCCQTGETSEYIVFDPPTATLKLNGSRVFIMTLNTGREASFSATTGSPLLRDAVVLKDQLHVFVKSKSDLAKTDELVKRQAAIIMRQVDPIAYFNEELFDILVMAARIEAGPSAVIWDQVIHWETGAPVHVGARVLGTSPEERVSGTVLVVVYPDEFL